MQRTVFDTPLLKPLLGIVSRNILRPMGWRIEGRLPDTPKYLIIGAYHTSNWDFVMGLLTVFALEMKVYWIGKDNLFRPPFDRFFSWLGGIPIDRRSSQNMVERIIRAYSEHESMVVALAPEGTRRKAGHWKTGFYHIAVGARVPIVMAFIDYRRKACGLGDVLVPTGDIETDMEKIRSFYAAVTAKFPELGCPPSIEPGRSWKKTS